LLEKESACFLLGHSQKYFDLTAGLAEVYGANLKNWSSMAQMWKPVKSVSRESLIGFSHQTWPLFAEGLLTWFFQAE